MSTFEFRVATKREGQRINYRVYRTENGARRRLLLYGPEPWRGFRKEPDAFMCCTGAECGCGGMTLREHTEQLRAKLPKLEFARLERREVSAWGVCEP